jgi:hypothetical protein
VRTADGLSSRRSARLSKERFMKVRIIGLPDEVREFVDRLPEIADVIEISNPYPCRGTTRNIRVYGEIRMLDAVPGKAGE